MKFDRRGSTSLAFVAAVGVVLAIGMVGMRMAYTQKAKRLVDALDTIEGFYNSDFAAWSMMKKKDPDQEAMSETVGMDGHLKGNVRRFEEGKMHAKAEGDQACGMVKFGNNSKQHMTCLRGLAASSCRVSTAPVSVPGTANIYLAGMPNGSTIQYTSVPTPDAAPTESPVLVPFSSLEAGAVMTFATSGANQCGPECGGGADADGMQHWIAFHESGAYFGKSSIQAPQTSLIGVFVDDSAGSKARAAAAPEELVYDTLTSRNQETYAPLLYQVFFIGDGKTNSGAVQRFSVPVGATKLYLGSMEHFESRNNSGNISVTTTIEASRCLATLPPPPVVDPCTDGLINFETLAKAPDAGRAPKQSSRWNVTGDYMWLDPEEFKASHGVTICADNDKNGRCDRTCNGGQPCPLGIAAVGGEATGFVGTSCDSPPVPGMTLPTCIERPDVTSYTTSSWDHPTVGHYFLASGDQLSDKAGVVIEYDTPVSEASGDVYDIDDGGGAETMIIQARDINGNVIGTGIAQNGNRENVSVGTIRIAHGDPLAVEGGSIIRWSFKHATADIYSISLNMNADGVGFDNFSPSRACPAPPAPSRTVSIDYNACLTSGRRARTQGVNLRCDVNQVAAFVDDGDFDEGFLYCCPIAGGILSSLPAEQYVLRSSGMCQANEVMTGARPSDGAPLCTKLTSSYTVTSSVRANYVQVDSTSGALERILENADINSDFCLCPDSRLMIGGHSMQKNRCDDRCVFIEGP